jgi:hypothetical protein
MKIEDMNLGTATQPVGLATLNPASITGLADCIEDGRLAALDRDSGPAEPLSYNPLLGRIQAVGRKFPPLYRHTMVTPFLETLRQIGAQAFHDILARDPERQALGGLMMDIAQAILQQGEGFAETATDAFEEVVSDLYDGFLSAEDRHGVNPPDLGAIPPLVKWGHPDFGPYTWPVDATSVFGCQAAVVNLPPANSRKGLVAWSALGHETAGHDILHADIGLAQELSRALQQNLRPLGHDLDAYWSARIDETAADVMGILNIGQAAGIGLVAYFRALNAAFSGKAKLRSEGPENDPHPADVLRGYLAAETVLLLRFTGRRSWSNLIANETNRDVTTIVLAGQRVSNETARQSAKIVAQTLVGHPANALEGHALGEIQNWRDTDERKMQRLRAALRTGEELPATTTTTPTYAAHVVAAAVTEALADGTTIPSLFHQMLTFLKTMHDQNPSWGPLLVAHPGNIARHLTSCRALDKPETVPGRSGSHSIRARKRSVSPPKRSMTRSLRKHSR